MSADQVACEKKRQFEILFKKFLKSLEISLTINDGFNRTYDCYDILYVLNNGTEIYSHHYCTYKAKEILRFIAEMINNGVNLNDDQYNEDYDPYDPDYKEPEENVIFVDKKLYDFVIAFLYGKHNNHFSSILCEGVVDNIKIISKDEHDRLYGTKICFIKDFLSSLLADQDKKYKIFSKKIDAMKKDDPKFNFRQSRYYRSNPHDTSNAIKGIVKCVPCVSLEQFKSSMSILLEANCYTNYERDFLPVYEKYFQRWVFQKWYSEFLRNPHTELGKRTVNKDYQRLLDGKN